MYRSRLYEAITPWRAQIQLADEWPSLADVPKLSYHHEANPTISLPRKGIQLTDVDINDQNRNPSLYLKIYFKSSRFYGDVDEAERWLYLEAHMRFALSIRIQVRAWNNRDIEEFMSCLHSERNNWGLDGPRGGINRDVVGDQLFIWQEHNEHRLTLTSYTPSISSISIHARLTDDTRSALSGYLIDTDFTKRLK